MSRSPKAPSLPLRPIPAALIAILALAPLEAVGVQTVSNCADSGDGSLRNALAAAADGELIDATGLALVCSTISLTSNPLIVANTAQKIAGPGSGMLTIDGSGVPGSGVIFHNGTGTLEMSGVALRHGSKYLNSDTTHVGGGCLFSAGNLKLDDVVVSDCSMTAGPKSHARGGAVYAVGYATLVHSAVSGGSAHGASPFGYEMATYGGGVFAKGAITLDHSTISGSHALNGGGMLTQTGAALASSTLEANDAQLGGGLRTDGWLQMTDSTLANNHADLSGALYVTFQPSPSTASFIRNSTITGNTIGANISAAAGEIGVPITISNSTIAFNVGLATSEGALYSLGGTLTLQSSIVAGNYPLDVDVQDGTVVDGANNLSPASRPGIMPADTKTVCPLLEPLAYTGGPTPTLALKHDSPAIGFGSNLLALANDQRGSGFPRAFAAVDIGAWEWQGGADDDIFHDGFNPRPGVCQN